MALYHLPHPHSPLLRVVDPAVNDLIVPRFKIIAVSADEFGRPNVNPPNIVDQDNVTLYSFTLNTDRIFYKFPVPSDYDSGNLEFWFVWTNDGGVDDSGRNVRWRMDYQTSKEGDSVSGSHANSPKTVEDTYESVLGWIEHHTDRITIAAADFVDKFCVYIKISAVTPTAPALTCEPHLVGLCLRYKAKIR